MVGIMIFPAKPSGDYEFKKNPKKVFELDDGEALSFSRRCGVSDEFFHYLPDMDKSDDRDIIGYFSGRSTVRDISGPRKAGKGYISGDKKWLIRVLKCDREWFRNQRY